MYCGPVPFTHVREHWTIFEAYFSELARSFRVIYFDPRGTGMSERDVADVSHATLLMDAEAVIDAARIDRLVVFAEGTLLAFWTVLNLATKHPDKVTHLVLESPFMNMGEIADTPFGRVGLTLAEKDWSIYVQTMFRILAGWDAGSDWIDPMATAAAGWADPPVGLQYTKLYESTDLSDILSRVQQPTIVLRNDPAAIPARCGQRVAAKIRGSQFVQYSDPTYADQQAELIRAFVLPSSSGPPDAAVVSSQPGAVRTVLFTDLVGHTEMMSRLGDAKGREVLREHERITREVLKGHGGTEIKTDGDSFMVSFGSVTKAVECAVALQRAFAAREGEPLHIRIGLNAGEPIEEDGPDGRVDLFGATVILASRIAAKADGGEILVSDNVRSLCSGKGFLFADRGEFVAKGFEEPLRVYEVSWRG
jgi:class 3 adenylate cyclase